jgi:hypothetical protein
MVEAWVYVIGGIIVALIAFFIAYNLLSQLITNSERQNALNQFSDIYNSINTICLGGSVGDKEIKTIHLPSITRLIYATDKITCNSDEDCPGARCSNGYCIFPTVTNLINKKKSTGKNICLQFKDEMFLRCYPEPPKKLYCSVSMYYLGVLPETEDIWVKVSKILGRPIGRDYILKIVKVSGTEIEVLFE